MANETHNQLVNLNFQRRILPFGFIKYKNSFTNDTVVFDKVLNYILIFIKKLNRVFQININQEDKILEIVDKIISKKYSKNFEESVERESEDGDYKSKLVAHLDPNGILYLNKLY